MRTAALLIFSLILSVPIFPQWTWRNQLPQGNPLVSNWFVNSDTGFCVGWVGAILRTTDGGGTWNILNFEGDNRYRYNYGVCFPDASAGYFISHKGYYDEIYKTTDLGESWELIYAESENEFIDIFFTDTDHGFVICASGKLLITSDGGITWQEQYPSSFAYLESIWFASPLSGYISGYPGIILHTDDGGVSWTQQITNTDQDLTCIHFCDSTVGYAAGSNGIILRTINGGEEWEGFQHPDSIEFYSIGAFNPDTVLIIGIYDFVMSSTFKIFRTIDGGNNWSEQTLDDFSPFFRDLYCCDDGTAYICGEFGLLAKSDDFGETWDVLSQNLAGQSIQEIDFPSDDVGYAVASEYGYPFSSVLKTTDGGDSWNLLDSLFQDDFFHSVDFATANWGMIAGTSIYRTIDGGHAWMLSYDAGWLNQIKSIECLNQQKAVAVGESGIILRTSNFGQSWISVNSGTTATLFDVCFPNEQVGYIAGTGVILKSTNSGGTWTLTSVPHNLRAIWFNDSDHGYAVGYYGIYGEEGVLIKTTDGGDTWNEVIYPDMEDPLYDIHFKDADTGYMAGGIDLITSVLFKTTNGGVTWQEEILPYHFPFYSVHVTPVNKVYVGGWGGVLLGNTSDFMTGESEAEIDDNAHFMHLSPNPAIEQIKVSYELQDEETVVLSIWSFHGMELKKLINQRQSKGIHGLTFGTEEMPSGIYFLRLLRNGFEETRKFIVIK